jgi:quercetin dioxygenase-like cupin family protein
MFCKQDLSNYSQILPGISKKALVYGDNSLLCEFHLKQGSIIPPHKHPQEQTGYLISGRLLFTSNENKFIAEPGSSWNFKADVEHSAEVLEDSVAIELFSPIRQDYLT